MKFQINCLDVSYYLSPFILHRLRFIKHRFHFLKHKAKVSENERYHNIHRGKRCFILGSGPSMAQTDISALANEHMIVLNSFFMNPQCNEVLSKPDPGKYYLVPPNHPPQSEEDWVKTLITMEEKIKFPLTMFWGIDYQKGNWRYLIEKNRLFEKFTIRYFYCGIHTRDGYRLKRSDMNFGSMSLSASNALINALELALFMGFDEIYLLGFEHNHLCVQKPEQYRAYPRAEHYKKEEDYDFGENRPNHINFEILGNNYYTFSIYLQIMKIFPETRIVNCTPGGILDVFPRQKLEDILK